MMMQNVRSSIHNTIHWLVLLPMLLLASCAGSDSEESHDTPALSDIPVSFKAESKWDESKTRLSESTTGTGNTVSFEKDDKIGIFAYYNNSTTPNFMNNQLATCTEDGGSSWSYSPIKYWPNNEKDDISFYAYYPYRESEDKTLSVSSSSETPLTIEYNCPNADIDLMVAKGEDLKYSSSAGKVSLGFKHLLARVKFTFTYTGSHEYHPVIHVLKYTIPHYQAKAICYKADLTDDTNKAVTFKWTEMMSDTAQVMRFVSDAAGTVLDKENQLIPEFTAYLLPCTFPYSAKTTYNIGSFVISLNNKLYTYTPTKAITVEAGKSYTINFKIAKNSDEASSTGYFITSYSIWKDGGTIEGILE